MTSILRILRAGAVRARSSISVESWRYIERLCSDRCWLARRAPRQNAGLARLIEDSLQALAAFAGSAQENLTRNYAWRFLEMGRRIERGAQIAHLAERLAGKERETEETYLRAWLTLSDSTAAYRARYMMTADAAAVRRVVSSFPAARPSNRPSVPSNMSTPALTPASPSWLSCANHAGSSSTLRPTRSLMTVARK